MCLFRRKGWDDFVYNSSRRNILQSLADSFFFFLVLSVYIASYIQIAFFVHFLSPLLAFLETKVLLMSILHQLGFRLLILRSCFARCHRYIRGEFI